MGNARILVVEDETIVALELRDRLLGLGYEVATPMASGEGAFEEIERWRPDLVLMDIKIQGRYDGIEIAQWIRERHDLPVVFLTAYADRSTLERAKVTAPCGYLLKPFDDRLLEITIETALLRHRSRLERQRWEAQRTQFIRRIISTQEDERRRIAFELHDALGQSLTSALLKLGTLEESAGAGGGRELLAEIRAELSGMLEEVRRLAHGLHPAALDALGFETALERLVEEFNRDRGIILDLHVRGFEPEQGRLPREIETTLYRIAQEALTNVARHSEARTASLVAERGASTLSLIVEDDGKGVPEGLDAEKDGLGLHGIRERVSLLGGTFTFESTSGRGTTLFVRLPLTAEPEDAGQGSTGTENP